MGIFHRKGHRLLASYPSFFFVCGIMMCIALLVIPIENPTCSHRRARIRKSTKEYTHVSIPSDHNIHEYKNKSKRSVSSFEINKTPKGQKKTNSSVFTGGLKLWEKTYSDQRCLYHVFIYSHSIDTIGRWPEYRDLRNAFKESGNVFSQFFDTRLNQHDEFSSLFLQCPKYSCDIMLSISDKEEHLQNGDAIIINMNPLWYTSKMVSREQRLLGILPPGVRIIFYGMESPNMMSHWDPSIKNLKYHYTMTYHSASAVYHPYGRYIDGEPTDIRGINYAENKTGLMVWMASNCLNTFWPRMAWVKRLQQLMPLDRYGPCGNLTCAPRMAPKCVRNMRVYKFYLALENSPCEEYITEKFWVNSILNGIVPVVYGGTRAAYERVAPPHSFIHIADFSSQRELANYLEILDRNDKLYSEYFAWRKHGRAERIYPWISPYSFCAIIPKLNENVPPLKSVGESQYFSGCQGGAHRKFANQSHIVDWKP